MSITWSITGTNEQVTFNSESSASEFDVSSTFVTSETITSAGFPYNDVELTNSGETVTSLIINGATFIRIDFLFYKDFLHSFVGQLNSINASAILVVFP